MINRENLERVKTILAQVPQGRFDLDQWNNLDEVDYNGPIELDTELKGEGCGFIGCVIGWAALDPFFNKQGLLTDDFGGAMRFVREDGVNVFADEFVPHLFGIPAGVACALIGVDPGVGVSYSAWTRFFYGSYNWNAPSETDVIRAIDWVLANETLLKGEPPEGTLYPEA